MAQKRTAMMTQCRRPDLHESTDRWNVYLYGADGSLVRAIHYIEKAEADKRVLDWEGE